MVIPMKKTTTASYWLWPVAPPKVQHDGGDDIARLLQPRRLDERDRVARRVQDDVAPEDQRRRNAAFRERRLIAATTADRLERDPQTRGGHADPVRERRALVRCLEGVAAAADDIEVEVRDEALDASRGAGHAAGVGLGAAQPLLFAGPCDEDDRASQLGAPGRERARDLDRDRGSGCVVVRGSEDRATRVRADAIEVSAHEHGPLRQ